MRKLVMMVLTIALVAVAHQAVAAEDCAADHKTRVAANGECLVIKVYGEPAKRTSLLVFIHGDGYRRDPSDYRPSDYLHKVAREFGAKGVVAVNLLRPGYFDSHGADSTGNSYRDGDNYRPDVIATVAAAIKTLKHHYNADNVVLAGHSGGSAISGVIIGKYPSLVNAAVLGACPCNVPAWRIMRRGKNKWRSSLSPHNFIATIDKQTEVVAVTGADDGNTVSVFTRDYVASLKRSGVAASFIEVPDVGHDGVEKTRDYKTAIDKLLKRGP